MMGISLLWKKKKRLRAVNMALFSDILKHLE